MFIPSYVMPEDKLNEINGQFSQSLCDVAKRDQFVAWLATLDRSELDKQLQDLKETNPTLDMDKLWVYLECGGLSRTTKESEWMLPFAAFTCVVAGAYLIYRSGK